MRQGRPLYRIIPFVWRGLLKGVASYFRAHGNWSVRHQEMSIHTQPPRWLAKCNGDGILARIESDQLAETIAALGIPAVDLRCSVRIHGIPQINTDDTAVVRMAVNHLRERGMRNFAFCGFATADYSVRRLLQAQQDRTANWFCA